MVDNHYAHYDKDNKQGQPLVEHLRNVRERIRIPSCVSFEMLSHKEIVDLCEAISYFHDIGKFTDFFQEYMVKGKKTSLKHHSHLSACLVFLYLTDNLSKFCPRDNIKHVSFFIAYMTVRFHHSSLRLSGLFPGTDYDKTKLKEDIVTQAENILGKYSVVQKELDEINLKLKGYLEYIDELFSNRFFFHMPSALHSGRFSRNTNIWFFLLIYLFSVLIDTDKSDSAGIQIHKKGIFHPEIVGEYILKKHDRIVKNEFIARRDKARKVMADVIEKLNDQQVKKVRFFTITAPTGIGKTLAAFESALRLQNKIEKIEGYSPRIITAIPFINIIEQTRDDYEKMIGPRGTLVIHHGLADFTKGHMGENEVSETTPLDRLLLEVESWEGDVILTTFVQLFQSLLSASNRLLKKINKLAGSIVILDEVQAIPVKYMPLLGGIMIKLGEYFGTRFILMTATQPKILEFGQKLLNCPEIEKIELLPDNVTYFNELKRTKFVPMLEPKLSSDEFISLFLKNWENNKSALIVVNTIKRSINIYNRLIKEQEEGRISKSVHICYLSTNIVPLQRKRVIDDIKKRLKATETVILVSTQTIEAGVDLDFDMGFRDLAPLESLVQTAGRINREGRKGEFLPVFIVQIKEGSQTDCQKVYKLYNLTRTAELLAEKLKNSNKGFIGEPEYRELVEQYYERELAAGIANESINIWENGIRKLDFEEINKFQLIEKTGEVVDVFVELDELAYHLANAYEAVKGLIDQKEYEINYASIEKVVGETVDLQCLSIYELKALLKLIKAKMNDYIIQLRAVRAVNNRPFLFSDRSRGKISSNLYWIPKENIKEYYDYATGFIDEGGEALLY